MRSFSLLCSTNKQAKAALGKVFRRSDVFPTHRHPVSTVNCAFCRLRRSMSASRPSSSSLSKNLINHSSSTLKPSCQKPPFQGIATPSVSVSVFTSTIVLFSDENDTPISVRRFLASSYFPAYSLPFICSIASAAGRSSLNSTM